jgi:hypothetical protein
MTITDGTEGIRTTRMRGMRRNRVEEARNMKTRDDTIGTIGTGVSLGDDGRGQESTEAGNVIVRKAQVLQKTGSPHRIAYGTREETKDARTDVRRHRNL